MPKIDSPARAIARNVLVVVSVFLVLYVIWLLRQPISWLVIAAFLAVAVAGPVNFLQRYMKRGIAIALVYFTLLLIPIGLGALLLPPIVNQVSDVATNAPSYVKDVEDYVHKNKTLNDLNDKYDITQKLNEEAAKLPSQGAARHRLRAGQLHLRGGDDPDPEHLHGRRRTQMDRGLHPHAATGARRAHRANAASDRQCGR
jgi:predicted PurR-regulated permease PerM